MLKENTKSKSVNYELIFYSFRYENMDFEEDSENEGNFDPLDVEPKVEPSDFTDTVETPCHNSVNSLAFDSTPVEDYNRKIKEVRRMAQNFHKGFVSNEIKEIVRRNFSREMEFYDFCKSRLQTQLKEIRTNLIE